MTCNHQLRVLGNPDDGRGDRETKQRLKGREERKQTNNNNKQKKKDGHFTAHTSHNRNQELSGGGEGREGGRVVGVRSEGGRRRRRREGEARGSPGNKTFSLCVYDACQTNDKWPKTFFLVVKIWGVVTKKKKKIYLYDKPTEGGGVGGGEPGGSICKMCVFFSVVFFIFYDNYLFSLGMYWINVCTCSVPSWSSFELVLKVNMKHWK